MEVKGTDPKSCIRKVASLQMHNTATTLAPRSLLPHPPSSARCKQLEKLLPNFEHRSFRYDYDGDGAWTRLCSGVSSPPCSLSATLQRHPTPRAPPVIQARNCMLALWLYLLTNFDHISVLHYQDLAYSMVRAIMVRKEVSHYPEDNI